MKYDNNIIGEQGAPMILSYVTGQIVSFSIELEDSDGNQYTQWLEGVFEDYDGPFCVISEKYVGFQTEDVINRRIHYSNVKKWSIRSFVDQLLEI